MFKNSIGSLFLFCLVATGGLEAQVGPALDQAEAWLLEEQNLNGSFGTQEALVPRDAAAVVVALEGRAMASQAVDRAAVYLSGVPEENTHFRSRRALALARSGRGYAHLLSSLLDFRNGGGMGAGAVYHSNFLDTALAIQALTLDEETFLLDVVSLLDYLQVHQAADGGWGYAADQASELYFSAEVLQALGDLDQLTVGQDVLDRTTAFLAAYQQADGSFGSTVETAVAYRAWIAAGRSDTDLPFGSPLAHLLASQIANGSWEDDVFTTAQVVRVLRLLQPNLVLTQIELLPSSVLPGTPVEARVTVQNAGFQPAGATHVGLRLDALDGELLADLETPALAVGEEITLTLPFETSELTASADLVVRADDREALDEVDEEDNHATARLTLRTGPDLAFFAADLGTAPERPLPETDFELRLTARNLGESEVSSFDYRVMRLVGGVPAGELASGTAGPVAPGGALLLPVTLNLPEGEHSVEAILDPEDLVIEEMEENNRAALSFFVVDPNQADLAVLPGDLVLTPSAPSPGDSVQVDLTVRNLGGRSVVSDLALFENDPGDGGIELERFPVNLAAGESTTLTTTLTLGAEAHSLTALADPEGAVVELDELNNRRQEFFRDLSDLALAFDNLEFEPTTPLEGDPVTVTVTLRNAGRLAATAVDLAVYDGAPEAGGTSIFQAEIDEIPAGGNRRTSFTWMAQGGLHDLVALVDPDNQELEYSESNNRTSRRVTVPRSTGPDLQVATVDRSSLTESALDLGISGSLGVTLQNLGDEAVSTPFELRAFVDRNGNRGADEGEEILASTVVSEAMAAGGSLELSLALNTTLPFVHPLAWVEVDPGDVVAEKREDNNQRALFAECTATTPTGSIAPATEWTLSGLNVEAAPLVVQLSDDNGDGAIDSRDVPDVVFHSADAEGNALFARSGLDGSEVWTFRSSPAHPLMDHLGQPAAADLNGDGLVEILAHQVDGRLVALTHKGAPLWVSDVVEGVGSRGLGGPAVGDLDGDGVPEIVLGRSVLSNTGQLIAQGTGNRGQNQNFYGPFGVTLVPGATSYAQSLIADIDLDGRNELVAGDTVYRLVAGSLEIVWDHVEADRLMVDGFSAVGNLDGDPEAEIVYVSSGRILILHHDGSVAASARNLESLASSVVPTFWGSAPTLVDLDGNGTEEILVSTATHVSAWNSSLQVLWKKPIGPDFGGITGVTAFDLDGDGVREVLFNDESTFYILDGLTGAVRFSQRNISATALEYPVVADVDGDGRVEILLASNRGPSGDISTQGLHVLGHPSWRGTRPMWNQYGYHVTNVALDGTVPSPQTAPSPSGNGFRVNRELPAPFLHQPNLTLGLPRVGAAGDEGVPVTLRLGNGGLEAVQPGVEIQLLNEGGETLATRILEQGLLPGAWLDMTLSLQVAVAEGTQLTAVVDAANQVDECDEGDNEVSFVFTETLLPDLLLAAPGLSGPATATAGQQVTITAEVRNDGTATATASALWLYLGDPQANPGAPVVATVQVPDLSPGQTAPVELSWDTRTLLPGPYALHARLDAEGLLAESEEGNNSGVLVVELAQPTLPDLSAESLELIPADPGGGVESGVQVLARVTVVNRGADLEGGFTAVLRRSGAEVARQDSPATLAAGESRELQFTVETLGLSGTYALEAVLDPDGLLPESDESNNRATAELVVAGSTLSLEVLADRLAYLPGETVAIDLVARNLGATSQAGDLRLRVLDAFGVEIAQVASETLELPVGQSARSYTWNTGTHLPGPYTLLAEFVDGGETVARAVRNLSLEEVTDASATLVANRDVFTPLDIVRLAGGLTNTSPNTPLDNLAAQILIFDAGGGEIFSTQRTFSFLGPGGYLTFEASWPVAGAGAGIYDAQVRVRDAFDRLVAFAETSFRIEDSAQTGAGLDGQLSLAPNLLGAGAPLIASFSVENGGNADFAELLVRLDLLELATEEVRVFQDTTLELPRQESRSGGFAFATGDLAPGTYLAVLRALPPQGAVRLDAAVFTLERGVSIADAQTLEGDAGSQTLNFAVTLSSAAEETVSVHYATRDSSAEAGLDYTATEGDLVFAPGEVSQTVSVEVLGDLDFEATEDFLVELSEPQGVLLGDAQALGTLLDEEGCSSPNLLANPGAEQTTAADELPSWQRARDPSLWSRRFGAPVPLEGLASFRGTGGQLEQEVDLGIFDSAIDAGGQILAFGAFLQADDSQQASSAQVTVDYLDANGQVLDSFSAAGIDGLEGWQSLRDQRILPTGTRIARIRLQSGNASAVSFDRLTLKSLGRRTLIVGDTQVVEGDGTARARFELTLSCPAPAAVDVELTTEANGSAAPDVDFTSTTEIVTFAPGSLSQVFEVPILADALDEANETFVVRVTSLSGDALLLDGEAIATVLDDDGTTTLLVDDLTVLEGDEGTTEALFEVRLSSISGRTITVDYATAPGTASTGDDFTARTGRLTFAPGEEVHTIGVPVLGDRLDEIDEIFFLELSNPQNAILADGRGQATVRDDDEVSLRVDPLSLFEGDPGDSLVATFPVTLSIPSTRTVTVAYETVDGEALAGEDYESTAGTLTFAPGNTVLPIPVPILSDLILEANETFLLRLSEPTEASFAMPEATATIFDDDGILFSVGDVEIGERIAQVLVPVTLNKAATETVSVLAATAPSGSGSSDAVAAEDYTSTSQTLTFPPGTTRIDLVVPLLDDDAVERDETFHVVLSEPSAPATLFDDTAVIRLLDDDLFVLNGAADDTTIPGCLLLTPDGLNNQAGSAWSREPLDLRQNFDLTFEVYLGQDSGSDGIVFALQQAGLDALGFFGGAVGFHPIAPSLGVKIDTFTNEEDPPYDYISVLENGSLTSNGHPPVPARLDSGNVEDGQRHLLRVIWNADHVTLDVHFDGVERLHYTKDVVNQLFGGDPLVTWGLTSGSGFINQQYACPTIRCASGGIPQFSVGDVRLAEDDPVGSGGGTVDFHFPVTLSCPVEYEVTVAWRTLGGSAETGTDFVAGGGTLTFAPGETSSRAIVTVLGDGDQEIDESFAVELYDSAGATLRHIRGIGTIDDDDGNWALAGLATEDLPQGCIQLQPYEVLQLGGAAWWRQPLDLRQPFDKSFDIYVGENADSSDGITFTLQAQGLDAVGGWGGNIGYNGIAPSLAVELDTFSFQGSFGDPSYDHLAIHRDGNLEHLVHPPVPALPDGGSITDDQRHRLRVVWNPTSQELDVYFDGYLRITQSIDLAGEIFGGDPAVYWGLTAANGNPGTHYFCPLDTCGNPQSPPSLSIADARVQEGDYGSLELAFPVSLSCPVLTPVEVAFHTVDGTATADIDYRATAGTLTFAPGQTQAEALLEILGDFEIEGDETFFVDLTAPSGTPLLNGRATGTILENDIDDGSCRPTLSIADVVAVEGEDGERETALDVTLSCAAAQVVEVDYLTAEDSTAPNPATAGIDFRTAVGTLTFAPGQTTAQVVVSVLGDTQDEGDETFLVHLLNPRGAELARDTATVTISQDELGLTIDDIRVSEGDEGTRDAVFTVSLSAPSPLTVKVDYFTGDGTAGAGSDYVAVSGQLVFAPGETEHTLIVPILGDTEVESDETFQVTLENPVNARLLKGSGIATIVQDDLNLTVHDAQVRERNAGETGVMELRVTLDAPSGQQVQVDYTTRDDTALAGLDYEATAGTLAIPAGAVEAFLRVPILGDDEIEASELFFVDLKNPTGARLADAEAVAVVVDDDECPSHNLLFDGSGEQADLSDWVRGTGTWTSRSVDPAPALGTGYFAATADDTGELFQDVNVEPFAATIDSGSQRFLFDAYLYSALESPADLAQVVVEYRDAEGTVLDTYDSGSFTATNDWRQVVDFRWAPAGTRIVRVRLISQRQSGPLTQAFFDGLSLRALGTPSHLGCDPDDLGFRFSVHDVEVRERSGEVLVPVTLDKASTEPLSVVATTAASGVGPDHAVAEDDYVSTTQTLTFAPGVTRMDFMVPVINDDTVELDEAFQVVLSDPSAPALIYDATADVRILDQDLFALNGTADDTSIPGCFLLTPDTTFDLAGTAWSRIPIDLRYGFDLTFEVYFGQEDGSDGIVFALQQVGLDALGEYGGAHGFHPIAPSVGVKVDTYVNGSVNDPDYDYISVVENGSLFNNGFPPVPARVDRGNIENEQRHLLRVIWNPVHFSLDVHFDDVERVYYTKDIVNEIFGGDPLVTWGLTAGSGFINLQYFCPTVRCADGSPTQVSVGDVTLPEDSPPGSGGGLVDFHFPVTLSCPVDHEVTVDWRTLAGSAEAEIDFLSDGGTITFAPGETSATAPVTVLGDIFPEDPLETFTVELFDPSGATLRYDRGLGTIVEDGGTNGEWILLGRSVEDRPEGCIELTPYDVQTIGSAAWWSKPIDLGQHFDQSVDIYVGRNGINSSDGITFTFQNQGLDAVGSWGGNIGYNGIVPSLGVEVDTFSVPGFFGDPPYDHLALQRDGTLDHQVHPPVPALPDESELADDQRHRLRVVWNSTAQELDVYLDGHHRIRHPIDMVQEIFSGESEVYWGLTASNGYPARHYFCPLDTCDDPADPPTLSIADARIEEGDYGSRQMVFPVTLSCPPIAPLEVAFSTADGTAVAGLDYRATAGTLTFPRGETRGEVVVEVFGDPEPEDDETFFVDLLPAPGIVLRDGSAIGTLLDEDIDDGTCRPALTIADAAVTEGASGEKDTALGVSLSCAGTQPIEVDYFTSDDPTATSPALAGSDYRATAGTLTFAPGETLAEVLVSIFGDTETEDDETFLVHLLNPRGATLDRGSAIVVISQATEPELEVLKLDGLVVDQDEDGMAAPGDEVLYLVAINNTGETSATEVVLRDAIPENALLVAGTVTTSQGLVLSEEPELQVDLGEVIPGTPVEVTFQVRIADPFPPGVEQIVNQARVSSAELDEVLSDDPDTIEPADPTVTPVIRGATTVCRPLDFGDGWQTTWIGDADQGSTTIDGAALEITGDGTSLFRGPDNGVFVHRTAGGNLRFEVNLEGFPVDAGGGSRKAGIMVRSGLDALAPRVMVNYLPHYPGAGTTALQYEYRDENGVTRNFGLDVLDVPLPVRLALEKRGDVYTALYSLDDGNTWQLPGGAQNGTIAVDMGESVEVGMAVASYDAEVTLTARFTGAELCGPNPKPPVDPPPPVPCDLTRPLDVVYLLDLSGSMTHLHDGTSSRLEAAQEALAALSDRLALRGDGSRAALVTFSGFLTPEENLADGARIQSDFTSDFTSLDALVQTFSAASIAPNTPTPTALGLRGTLELLLGGRDAAHQPAVVLLTDGIANIDGAGRGPDEYTLSEVQAVPLKTGAGRFLSWPEVAWQGNFNLGISTFDGETLANAMYEIEQLKLSVPELLIYSVAFPGNGTGLGTFHDDLVEYAAWFSGGRAFQSADLSSLLNAVDLLVRDLECGGVGSATIGGRVWEDADGDGTQGAAEEGLEGVTLELFDNLGFGLTSTVTDANGQYLFTALPAGDYTVRLVAGSLPIGVSIPTFDFDGLVNEGEAGVTVLDGELQLAVDFGYQEQNTDPPGLSCTADPFDDGVLDGWTFALLGNADQGEAEEVDSSLWLTGDGTSLYRGPDNGAFLYQELTGNFRVEVDIKGFPVDQGGQVRKAGLMVRDSLNPQAPRVMVNYIPHFPDPVTTALQWEFRNENGTATNFGTNTYGLPLPVRLAIEREGDVLRASYSLDGGLTWRQPGGALQGVVEVVMGDSVLAGVDVASYDANIPLTASFDDFLVCLPSESEAP